MVTVIYINAVLFGAGAGVLYVAHRIWMDRARITLWGRLSAGEMKALDFFSLFVLLVAYALILGPYVGFTVGYFIAYLVGYIGFLKLMTELNRR
jgi:hypothetical protein